MAGIDLRQDGVGQQRHHQVAIPATIRIHLDGRIGPRLLEAQEAAIFAELLQFLAFPNL